MTDWVTNRIEFEASSEGEARQIYEAICIDNEFDFKTLDVPTFKAYGIAVGLRDAIFEASDMEDMKLFLHEQLFFDASLAHWYLMHTTCDIGRLEWLGGSASFIFRTAWVVPYPVIVAFGNKFKAPFTLKYLEEAWDSWGVERFELDENGLIKRTSRRIDYKEDWRDLHIELMGYEPEEDEEVTDS